MQKHERKTRCWACSSLFVQRWGKQLGRQRFKCNHCGIYFTSENPGVKQNNELIWFRNWVIERQTLSYISKDSGISVRQLQRKFDIYLKSYPQWLIPYQKVVNLVIDGTYFKNKICLFVYRNSTLSNTLLYRTTNAEHANEIYEDLINILKLGIVIESITCDGHTSALSAIKKVNKWIISESKGEKENTKTPQLIVVQRCLVHIQRNCLDHLKKEHKSIEGRRLRAICMTICKIETEEHRDLFIAALAYWFKENGDYVTQYSTSSSGKRWRTHKDLYCAYNGLKRALKDMFHYITNPNIPASTNSVESFFGHLKEAVTIHRGLSFEHQKNFLRWYIYFKNQC